MELEKLLISWKSAMRGLMILTDEKNKIRPIDKLTVPLNAALTEVEKEKIKEALDYIAYVLDIEVKKKKKGLFR